MQIVFLSHRVPYPPNKGEKIRTFHQIRYLAERGHRISVFAPTADTDDIDDLHALRQHCCDSTHHAPKPGATALLGGLLRGRALSVSNFYTPALQRRFDEFLSTQNVDAIVCTASSMAEYVFRSTALPTLTQHPTLVMDFMDLDSDKWRQYRRLKPFPLNLIYGREARLIENYERRILQVFDAGIFIAQAEVDLLQRAIGASDKLHVVANGLDTAVFRPSLQPKPAGGPNLLFTGVMDYLPNEDAVVWFVETAWQTLRSRHPQATFYIAGMNPSAKVKALSRFPGIIVTGFVEDIVEYYDRAHIFIAPFRIARGVQNKVLQAFACGLPTITTPMGIEGIACRDGEHVLLAETVDAMLERIDRLVAHPDTAAAIGANAAELMRRDYSWESQLASLEAILAGNYPRP